MAAETESPGIRPKRCKALASFYIDEDDFEDEKPNSKSKKKDELFMIDNEQNNSNPASDPEEDDDFEVEIIPEAVASPSKPVTKASSSVKGKGTPASAKTSKAVPKVSTASRKQKKVTVPAKPAVKSITLKSSVVSTGNTNKAAESFDECDGPNEYGEYGQEHDEAEEDEDVVSDSEESDEENKIKNSSVNRKSKTNLKSNLQKQSISKVNIPTSANSSLNKSRSKLPTNVIIDKVKLPDQSTGPRRVGLSRSAPTRPLSPVKIVKFN